MIQITRYRIIIQLYYFLFFFAIFIRVDNNTDMFRRLLIRSDPVIALKIGFKKKKLTKLTEEMKNLLVRGGLDEADDEQDQDAEDEESNETSSEVEAQSDEDVEHVEGSSSWSVWVQSRRL